MMVSRHILLRYLQWLLLQMWTLTVLNCRLLQLQLAGLLNSLATVEVMSHKATLCLILRGVSFLIYKLTEGLMRTESRTVLSRSPQA